MSNSFRKSQVLGHDQPIRFGLRGRLFLGFVAVVLVFAASVILSLGLIRQVERNTGFFLNEAMKTNHVIEDLQINFSGIEADILSIVVFHEKDKRQKLNDDVRDLDKLIIAAGEEIVALNDDAMNAKWGEFLLIVSKYKTMAADMLKLVETGAQDKAFDLYRNEFRPLQKQLNESFNVKLVAGQTGSGLLDVMGQSMVVDMNDIVSQVDRIGVIMIGFLIVAVLLSLIIVLVTAKAIVGPLKQAISIATKVAAGERDMEISSSRSDETGRLIAALGVMRDAIRDGEDKKKKYAEEIYQACGSMVATLEEVRRAVDAQSSGASEQASSINQITASITEIERSATQTMNKAKDLGSVAEKTRSSGQLGLESVEGSVIGMKAVREKVQLIAQTILDLSRQTQQVGEITSVVNNLAQQSKMLALNASIEAAKAGDAGRGFTVVASEVKNLAEQSEQSTTQVQKILEDIKIATEKAVMVTEEGTKGVDYGLQMIEKTGEIIRSLNDIIREATIASQQIEAAVRQESAGIEQITAGMGEINTVTTSFVESVSQTSEAMDDLAKVSSRLKSSVETYQR